MQQEDNADIFSSMPRQATFTCMAKATLPFCRIHHQIVVQVEPNDLQMALQAVPGPVRSALRGNADAGIAIYA